LPDPSHTPLSGTLAEQAGQVGLLDVAGPAEALERLGGVLRRPLARPVLHDRREQPLDELLVLVAGGVEGAGQAQGGERGRLGLDGQVGEHVGHQRLLVERGAEGRAVVGVPGGLGHALAHDGRGAEHAVEPGVVDHLDDGAHAPALVADELAPGVEQLDLARRVGPVAELVLEPLDADGVAAAVGEPARHEEAGEPAGGLGQHQEGVGHRRRAEPLVAGEAVGAVGGRASAVVVLARTSEPPCFSVMAMPQVAPAFSAGRAVGGS
jgi:hypothetical protein